MQEKLLQQARHEFSPRQRMIAMGFEGLIFLLILPFALYELGSILDSWLNFPALHFPPLNLILGVLLIAIGWPLAIWTIYVQFTLGRGTPVPLMATQKLIVTPPYTFSRNPMAVGAVITYLGVAVWIGSISALLLVLLGGILLFTYIKVFEEKEMVLRFGQEYLEYKRRTPFLISIIKKKLVTK
jgi:protein-S-isoprenylcysteine O-methyltransferase Ste14